MTKPTPPRTGKDFDAATFFGGGSRRGGGDDDPDAAEVHLRGALALAPEHREALKQLGTLQANLRGDFEGAIATFTRLRAVVADEAHLLEDVDRALAQLQGLVARR